jgi:hypothetical protein
MLGNSAQKSMMVKFAWTPILFCISDGVFLAKLCYPVLISVLYSVIYSVHESCASILNNSITEQELAGIQESRIFIHKLGLQEIFPKFYCRLGPRN